MNAARIAGKSDEEIRALVVKLHPPEKHWLDGEMTMTTNVLTVSASDAEKGGKSGKGGDFKITNAGFLAAVFPKLPESAFAAVCSKPGDPGTGGWPASRADQSLEIFQPNITTTSRVRAFYPR